MNYWQKMLSCLGAFIRPTSFTLTGLSSKNGSNANGEFQDR